MDLMENSELVRSIKTLLGILSILKLKNKAKTKQNPATFYNKAQMFKFQ